MSSWKESSEEGRSILLNDELIPLCQMMTRKAKKLILMQSIVKGVIGVYTRYRVSAEHLF